MGVHMGSDALFPNYTGRTCLYLVRVFGSMHGRRPLLNHGRITVSRIGGGYAV